MKMRRAGLLLFMQAAILAHDATAQPVRLDAGMAPYAPGQTPILLLGSWEIYAGNPSEEEIRSGRLIPDYADASLRSFILPIRHPPLGTVTYRARIRYGNGDPAGTPRRMALYFPGLEDFSAIQIDGRGVYGRIRGMDAPALIFFEAAGNEISILLRSGPGDRRLESSTLMPAFCLVGDEEQIVDAQLILVSVAVIVPAFFFACGLFLFVLFFFWRKNREFLSFALFMIALAVFYAVKHLRLFGFLDVHPAASVFEPAYIAALGLQYMSLGNFFFTMYRSKPRHWARPALLAIPAASIAAAILLPSASPAIYALSVSYYSLFGIAILAYLARRIATREKRARWLLPAFFVAVCSIAARFLLPDSLESAYVLEPLGMGVFAFACTLMLVKKVGDTFESAEALSDYVDSVARTMNSFIPKEFLENLQKSDVVDLRLGDHAKKEMTIFFSDIRAFTELSESLTVEENFAFINSYLSRMVPIIQENGGFIDKYIGDAIMALFPGPDGPDQSIRAAIAMQSKIVEYNGHRAKMSYRPISMGVGIHTGDLMLGVVGVTDRMENTVISDAVNLASRLQAITKAFNIALAISEQSFKELKDPGSYKYRFIGKVKVKGKAEPISVFEIFDGIAPELFERKMKANMFFEQGMLSYYQKDFAGSMYYFKRVLDVMPEDGAAAFYLDNSMRRASL